VLHPFERSVSKEPRSKVRRHPHIPISPDSRSGDWITVIQFRIRQACLPTNASRRCFPCTDAALPLSPSSFQWTVFTGAEPRLHYECRSRKIRRLPVNREFWQMFVRASSSGIFVTFENTSHVNQNTKGRNRNTPQVRAERVVGVEPRARKEGSKEFGVLVARTGPVHPQTRQTPGVTKSEVVRWGPLQVVSRRWSGAGPAESAFARYISPRYGTGILLRRATR
jgi:hypothetical protein